MQFEKEVKQSKKDFYWNKFKNCIGDSRQIYKLLNNISGKILKFKKKNPLQSCLNLCGNSTDADIADKFNIFFANIGKTLKIDLLLIGRLNIVNVPFSINLFKTNTEEFLRITNSLDNKYSSGVDYISNTIVDVSSEVVAPYLAFTINLSFSKGLLLKNHCKAKIFPLHKERSRTAENKYQTMSLLIVWRKIYK